MAEETVKIIQQALATADENETIVVSFTARKRSDGTIRIARVSQDYKPLHNNFRHIK